MRGLICAPAVVLALGLAACGGDDETTTTSGTQGADSGGEMTAGKFIDASIPDEVAAVQEAAEAAPSAQARTPTPAATSRSRWRSTPPRRTPDTPLSEIVAEAC